MHLKVYTDWGSRWNPGNAGLGVYITDDLWNEVEKRYKSLWTRTNNEAEYLWAYFWVKRAVELWAKKIDLFMDSDLVIKQLSWVRKIKKAELWEINKDIKKIISDWGVEVTFNWIPREKNKEADRLSNVAMDKGMK